MHLPFDILKKERDGSFPWFETMNDLGSAQQQIQQPDPIPQPAPAPEPAPEPTPAPQSDSNPNPKGQAIRCRYSSAQRLWIVRMPSVLTTLGNGAI